MGVRTKLVIAGATICVALGLVMLMCRAFSRHDPGTDGWVLMSNHHPWRSCMEPERTTHESVVINGLDLDDGQGAIVAQHMVEGMLVDQKGDPLRGWQVALLETSFRDANGFGFMLSGSDRSGVFRFVDVPNGCWSLAIGGVASVNPNTVYRFLDIAPNVRAGGGWSVGVIRCEVRNSISGDLAYEGSEGQLYVEVVGLGGRAKPIAWGAVYSTSPRLHPQTFMVEGLDSGQYVVRVSPFLAMNPCLEMTVNIEGNVVLAPQRFRPEDFDVHKRW